MGNRILVTLYSIIIILFFYQLLYGSNGENGSITLKANPDRVKVYINNKYYGTAIGPSTISNIKPGRYFIVIKKRSYQTWGTNIEVNSKQNIFLKIELKNKELTQNIEKTKSEDFNTKPWEYQFFSIAYNSLLPINDSLKNYAPGFSGVLIKIGFNEFLIGGEFFFEYLYSDISPEIIIDNYKFSSISAYSSGIDLYLNYPLFYPFVDLKIVSIVFGPGLGFGHLNFSVYDEIYYSNNHYFIIGGINIKYKFLILSFQYKHTYSFFPEDDAKIGLTANTQWKGFSLGVSYAFNLL